MHIYFCAFLWIREPGKILLQGIDKEFCCLAERFILSPEYADIAENRFFQLSIVGAEKCIPRKK